MALSKQILDILEKVQIKRDEIVEAERRTVIRAGKRVRKLICPPGFKALDNRCVKMKPAETRKRKRSQKKGARKRKRTLSRALIKRKRSLKKVIRRK